MMLKLGLIGSPIGHSLSPTIFNQFFLEESLEASYELFGMKKLPAEGIKSFMQQQNLIGLNVTIPHKVAVIPQCDVVHATAERIGAVNTLVLEGERLVGYNTDYDGIYRSFEHLGDAPEHALIFGNGGASKAVQSVLADHEIDFTVVARSSGDISFEALTDSMARRSLWWINTTPVGSVGNPLDLLPLPYAVLNEEFAIFDLVYRPVVTPLMQTGILAKSTVIGGEIMLNEQAKKAWILFRAAYYKKCR